MIGSTRKAPEAALPPETRLALYRLLVELRYTEKRAYDLFLQNLVKGTSHLALGQEAVAAGFGYAMQKDDYTFCTYRGHHHTLARGASMTGVLGELMGRECGLLAGKGGSMHLTSVDEAVNLAAVWKLPVVFVCENNLYMEYTPIRSVTAVEHPAADRAGAYGLPPIIVDGNDVEAVYRSALEVLGRARDGEGPSIVECKTYRHSGHSRADPAKYRPPEELQAWLERDPLPTYRRRLDADGVPEATLEAIERTAMAQVEQATETCKASPAPAIATAFTDLWADGGTAWRN